MLIRPLLFPRREKNGKKSQRKVFFSRAFSFSLSSAKKQKETTMKKRTGSQLHA